MSRAAFADSKVHSSSRATRGKHERVRRTGCKTSLWPFRINGLDGQKGGFAIASSYIRTPRLVLWDASVSWRGNGGHSGTPHFQEGKERTLRQEMGRVPSHIRLRRRDSIWNCNHHTFRTHNRQVALSNSEGRGTHSQLGKRDCAATGA